MKQKKKYIIILLLIVVLIVVIPNGMRAGKDNLRIKFKSDTFLGEGYAAVFGGERIYYVSNELEKSGIYSMNTKGEDIRLEITNPSVTNLQWKDESSLYFSALERIEDRKSSLPLSDHIYNIYMFQKGDKNIKTVLGGKDYIDINVRSFYLISDRFLAICFGEEHHYLEIIDTERNESIEKEGLRKEGIANVEIPITEQEPVRNGVDSKSTIDFFFLENVYIDLINSNNYSGILWDDPSIIDINTGRCVLSTNLIDGTRFGDYYSLMMDTDYLYSFYKDPYFSEIGQMVIVNRENWEVEKMFPLGDIAETHRVSYAMKRDGKIYMLAEQWASDDKAVLPLKNQKLLVMDSETFEWEVVRDMKEGERIVGLDERGIVYLADGGIWKAEWEGEALGGETRLCDAPKDIDKKKYTIDYAGDWMFVYKVYGGFTTGNLNDDPGQQLVYKINLKTGEVVENTVPLDFSQVAPYRRAPKTK